MDATIVVIDLAKDVFQVAVSNRAGRILDRQRFTRCGCDGRVAADAVGPEERSRARAKP